MNAKYSFTFLSLLLLIPLMHVRRDIIFESFSNTFVHLITKMLEKGGREREREKESKKKNGEYRNY